MTKANIKNGQNEDSTKMSEFESYGTIYKNIFLKKFLTTSTYCMHQTRHIFRIMQWTCGNVNIPTECLRIILNYSITNGVSTSMNG